MSSRESAGIWSAAFILMFATIGWGASVNEPLTSSQVRFDDAALNITDSTTGLDWNELRSDAVDGQSEPVKQQNLLVIVKEQPTPVAPVPSAFLSGGSVLLGAGMVRVIRNLKRAAV